jgi:Cu/Ag efflux pump CusA
MSDVAGVLELATQGRVVGQVLEGVNAFDLLVRLDEVAKITPKTIAETWVDTPAGPKIPLSALAAIQEDRSPNFISRENVQRKLVVMANVAGRDVGSVVDDMRAAIEADVALPSGYWIEYGGQFESAESTARRLSWLGLGIVVGIVGLLYAVFRSMRDTVLILLNLPLALMGGVLGVALSGGAFSVASMIGLITVFGVATRNGVMLVAHIRHLQRFEGVTDFREAVRRGSLERLAPILMTALATGLALVPLALRGDQPGNEILSPMAMVIICGMLSATVLNMAVVPTLFLRFARPVAAEEIEEEAQAS